MSKSYQLNALNNERIYAPMQKPQYPSTLVRTKRNENFSGKTLPAHVEAERAVLGAVLLDDNCISVIAEILTISDFYATEHQIIYKSILDLTQLSKRIDIVTVQDELIKQGKLDIAGGIVYLVGLQEDISAIGIVEQHAQIVKDKSVLRQLIRSATTIINNCYNQDEKGIDVVLDETEKTIFEILDKRVGNSFAQLDIWIKKTFQRLSNMKGKEKGVTGIGSGFKKIR